jgi:hypothetical protein
MIAVLGRQDDPAALISAPMCYNASPTKYFDASAQTPFRSCPSSDVYDERFSEF